MNKLYIPEIGDSLELTEDWTFDLYAERRNVTLAAFFGFGIYREEWVDLYHLLKEPPREYSINYPSKDFFRRGFFGKSFTYEERQAAHKKAEDESESYQAYLKAYNIWSQETLKTSLGQKIKMTLPKGVVLVVDRIYIRKGMSEYSSISFLVKELGEVPITNRWSGKVSKKKTQRFWVKLSDCNNIVFK